MVCLYTKTCSRVCPNFFVYTTFFSKIQFGRYWLNRTEPFGFGLAKNSSGSVRLKSSSVVHYNKLWTINNNNKVENGLSLSTVNNKLKNLQRWPYVIHEKSIDKWNCHLNMTPLGDPSSQIFVLPDIFIQIFQPLLNKSPYYRAGFNVGSLQSACFQLPTIAVAHPSFLLRLRLWVKKRSFC